MMQKCALKSLQVKQAIAIIGIGCRFPGGITNSDSFWTSLVNSVDAISEVPANRFDITKYFDPTPQTPGKMVSRFGGFLDNLDRFDADFFKISPFEARWIDPQQRLLLEVSWEAFEDAGIPVSSLSGSSTGVFIGAWLQDFESRLVGDPSVDDINHIDLYATTGSGRYSLAGRLSYFYGLQGPSLVVDTHCSSSLVAVHLACQSILLEESDIAVAGGVNVILTPYITTAYSQSGMIAPDGRCKFGDVKANGYVRSEGCGLVVLKSYSKAVVDGDAIYAVIPGSAVNNNGLSSGFLTTPGQSGQQDVLRKAYRRAGINPAMVQYVEAHGTGTEAGDIVEMKALGDVLADFRPKEKKCLVGSVKTNIGHTEGAAGVAGLIKVALALKHKKIPASLHFDQPNSAIPWDSIPLVINNETVDWPSCEQVRIGGVSSFGITGTNAHVVLQEAPKIEDEPVSRNEISRGIIDGKFLLPISAHSPDALREKVGGISEWLGKPAAMDKTVTIENICAQAAIRRNHLDYRLTIIADSKSQLKDRLAELLQTDSYEWKHHQSPMTGKPKLVFVFPGQGSQYEGMCQTLAKQSNAFRKSLEQCDVALKPFTDWSLLDKFDEGDLGGDQIDIVQPTLFAIQVAMAAHWRSWGISPDAVIGHSMGEVAAAYVCGALTLDEAARVITKRSQLMKRTSGQGAMALVELTAEKAREAIAGREEELSIAVCNSPRSVVLSGEPLALDVVLNELENRNIFCRKIKVDVASHSPQMDPLRPELVTALATLTPRASDIPMYSTVTKTIQDGRWLDNTYWGENLRSPVQFAKTVESLLGNNHNVFIEMSPHPLLLRAIDEIFISWNQEGDSTCLTLPSGVRDQDDAATLLDSLGKVYAAGYPLHWDVFYPQPTSKVEFPTYPWQRQRYWIETDARKAKSRSISKNITKLESDKEDGIEEEIVSENLHINESLSNFLETFQAAQIGKEREELLENLLKNLLSRGLGLPVADLDSNKAFKAYGMDSLKAMQFRGKIESATGLELSSSLVWNYPNVKKLASYLNDNLATDPELKRNGTPEDFPSGDTNQLKDLMDIIESMSDEEAKKLLEDES